MNRTIPNFFALALVALTAAFAAAADARPALAQGTGTPLGESVAPDLDALIARGRLQEAAWAAREAGDSAQAEALLARLEAILRAPPRGAAPLGMDSQGVSYTFRLQHEGGVESIFKVDGSDIFCPSCGADREVAAYRIDRLLGFDLTPVTVFRQLVQGRDTLSGSTMYFVAGARAPSDLGRSKPDQLRLFDAILGNSDRHAGNWLILPDGSVAAIDHNRAFEYRPSTRPKTCWETEVDSIADPAGLGAPFERYRSLPDDALMAAVSDVLDPELAKRFVAMRDPIVARIESRIQRPRRDLPNEDCPWGT